MKQLLAFLVVMSFTLPVYASGTDADLAAVKAGDAARMASDARHKAQLEEERRQNAAAEQQSNAQMAVTLRPMLGKAAEGKTDAEVVRLYEEKVARDDASGANDVDEAAVHAQSDAIAKSVTGKTTGELEVMSDEDIEKLEAETMKRYSH